MFGLAGQTVILQNTVGVEELLEPSFAAFRVGVVSTSSLSVIVGIGGP